MNSEHPSPELLQRYLDGELEPAERPQLEAHVAGCAVCGAERARSARLHDFVKLAVDDASQDTDFSALFAKIEAGLVDASGAPETATQPKQSKVIALTRSRRFANMAPALGAIALAAAVMLMVYRPDQGPQTEGLDETDFVPNRSEIVEVDFGTNAGTVFDIALSDGSSTPVVWIDDDDEDDDSPEE